MVSTNALADGSAAFAPAAAKAITIPKRTLRRTIMMLCPPLLLGNAPALLRRYRPTFQDRQTGASRTGLLATEITSCSEDDRVRPTLFSRAPGRRPGADAIHDSSTCLCRARNPPCSRRIACA